ncbi:MAG: DUF1848 domain-containing protein [Planctomycetes bacterium]|nr:DUF1848 domain-containing protein [Planctomycetota bacterium]
MIVSASRRTDVPAFYARWFVQRIRAGFCRVPNPFCRSQVGRVSLLPADVDVICFWTRNPRPLLRWLDELDARGHRYFFHCTVLGHPRELDPRAPALDVAIATVRELAARIGPERVIWRFDPIVLSPVSGPDEHLARFRTIAERLAGATRRCVVSVMDRYRKIEPRLRALAARGVAVAAAPEREPGFARLLEGIAGIAARHGMAIRSCAEQLDLRPYGIAPGACIDGDYLRATFGLAELPGRDPNQRAACGCLASRDIGEYDSCPYGCAYCYATASVDRAEQNRARHDPEGETLLP